MFKIFENKIVRGLAIILAFALLVGCLAPMIAYLTDRSNKEEVYTVGNVEAQIVGDQVLTNVEGGLMPGVSYPYARAAQNTGENDAFVFMTITLPYEYTNLIQSGEKVSGNVELLNMHNSVSDAAYSNEWNLVDAGQIGDKDITETSALLNPSASHGVIGEGTVTYAFGYIGDNGGDTLKPLKKDQTTVDLFDNFELANITGVSELEGDITTRLYAIQTTNVNGGLTDVNGVWAVINSALVDRDVSAPTEPEEPEETVPTDPTEQPEEPTSDPVYLTMGSSIKNLISSNITEVNFLSTPVPEEQKATATDVSSTRDRSILAWVEGTVMNIASVDGSPIYAHEYSNDMFDNSNIREINFENFNVSQVKYLSNMFRYCDKLTTIYASDWETEAVSLLDSGNMFNGCSNLVGAIEYDPQKNDITMANPTTGYFTEFGKVPTKTNILTSGGAFNMLIPSTTTEINFLSTAVPEEQKTTAKDVSALYDGSILAWSEGTVFNIASVDGGVIFTNENCFGMFRNLNSLTTINFENFDVSKATDMGSIFSGCSKLSTIYASDWATEAVSLTNSTYMFDACYALKGAVSFSASKTDISMANPTTGYFTKNNSTETQPIDGTKFYVEVYGADILKDDGVHSATYEKRYVLNTENSSVSADELSKIYGYEVHIVDDFEGYRQAVLGAEDVSIADTYFIDSAAISYEQTIYAILKSDATAIKPSNTTLVPVDKTYHQVIYNELNIAEVIEHKFYDDNLTFGPVCVDCGYVCQHDGNTYTSKLTSDTHEVKCSICDNVLSTVKCDFSAGNCICGNNAPNTNTTIMLNFIDLYCNPIEVNISNISISENSITVFDVQNALTENNATPEGYEIVGLVTENDYWEVYFSGQYDGSFDFSDYTHDQLTGLRNGNIIYVLMSKN